jgi:hypothetical protein
VDLLLEEEIVSLEDRWNGVWRRRSCTLGGWMKVGGGDRVGGILDCWRRMCGGSRIGGGLWKMRLKSLPPSQVSPEKCAN